MHPAVVEAGTIQSSSAALGTSPPPIEGSSGIREGVAVLSESPPPSPVIPTYARTGPSGRYGLQLAAQPSLEDAEDFLLSHATGLQGLEPLHVIERTIDGRSWFRIRVGAFRHLLGARKARERLPEDLGRGAMVIRYR